MDLSIVIPVFNEEKNIPKLSESLDSFLGKFGRSYEAIFIEDGSKDASWEEIKKACKRYRHFKGYKHTRNYGQTAAYQNGFDHARGKYILILSADNEVPVEEIGVVVKKLDEGYDLVNTNRVGRYKQSAKLALVKRIPSIIANKIIDKISGIHVKDTGSGLKGFRRVLIDNIRFYGEMHRYMPAYMSLLGAKSVEIDVKFFPRTYGSSSYGKVGLSRTFKVLLDIVALKFMLSFSTKPFTMMPIRFFGGIGFLFMSFGAFFGIYLTFLKVFLNQDIGTRPLLLLAVFLLLLGFQLISLGLIGELLLRTYYESQGKKTYIVREELE